MSPRARLTVFLLAVACSSPKSASDTALIRPQPDEKPIMVKGDLPFHYPGALYARRLQGNVTLRLYVDSTGRTVPESTRVEDRSLCFGVCSSDITGQFSQHCNAPCRAGKICRGKKDKY